MLSDPVCEYIVQKKIERPDKIKIAAVCIGYLALIILFVMLMIILSGWMPLIFVGLLGVIFLLYWTLISFRYEYEYSFFDGELRVDKIVNMRTRKHVVTVDMRNVTKMGDYDPDTFDSVKFGKLFCCSGSYNPEKAIYMIFRYKDQDNACLLIDKDDKMFAAMRPYIDASVYREGFGVRVGK